MNTIETKLIKITSRGPLNAIHGIHGPILNPYMEKVRTIFRLISEGATVVEVLQDKSEIKLDATNFNKDNEPKPEVKQEPVKQKVVETVTNKPSYEKPGYYDKGNKNKYNKDRNNNRNPLVEEKKELPIDNTIIETTDVAKEDEIKPIQPDMVEPK
jgi:hypothetical protein